MNRVCRKGEIGRAKNPRNLSSAIVVQIEVYIPPIKNYYGFAYSQGGVKVPTGGIPV
jgi:hypothetical protein